MDSYFLQKINKALAEGIFAKKMLNAKTAELSLADSTIKYQDTTINVLTRENLKVKTDIYFEKATIAAKIIENKTKIIKKRRWRNIAFVNTAIIVVYTAIKLKLL